MKQIRYWLIRKLAGNDEIHLNAVFDTSPSGLKLPDARLGGAYVAGCHFEAVSD